MIKDLLAKAIVFRQKTKELKKYNEWKKATAYQYSVDENIKFYDLLELMSKRMLESGWENDDEVGMVVFFDPYYAFSWADHGGFDYWTEVFHKICHE